jgi:hypothetical protein
MLCHARRMPMERNENGENEWRRCGGKALHFDRLRWWWVGMEAVEAKCGGCERSCCPGWAGMEVGKGQQAPARKKLGGRTPDHSDNEQDSPPHCALPRWYLCGTGSR